MLNEVDLLVVGAGPAGSSAALAGARAGLRTLLVEQGQVGIPVRCGEYVPAGLVREVPAGTLPVAQKVPSLALHLPAGDVDEVVAPGCVIDRDRFDLALCEAATRAGAELRAGSRLIELDRRGVALLGRKREWRVRAAVVVGADGPRSVVGARAGLGRPKVMVAKQRVVGLARPLCTAHLYFSSQCRFGYGWLFPKGDRANVGVAMDRASLGALGPGLDALVARLVHEGQVDPARADAEARAALVPAAGPLPRIGSGRILLAGDAAGQTDALTGAGIVAAVRAGRLAGESAAEALALGAPSRAGEIYETAWRRLHGRNAARQLWKRCEMEALWDRDADRAVRRAWR